MSFRRSGCFLFTMLIAVACAAVETATPAPPVPYPEGFRTWRHVASGVLPAKPDAANTAPTSAAPHGLIHHIYANEKALEGYRTGHFPDGAVLVADWFVLKVAGPQLLQGRRKSLNVMVRDSRYTETGGWGFEDFDQDSRTIRNVGPKAAAMCFECHTRVKPREYVFSELKP